MRRVVCWSATRVVPLDGRVADFGAWCAVLSPAAIRMFPPLNPAVEEPGPCKVTRTVQKSVLKFQKAASSELPPLDHRPVNGMGKLVHQLADLFVVDDEGRCQKHMVAVPAIPGA